MNRDQYNIYDSQFVVGLFNEMSATYGTVNIISSFGFCLRWRRQCIALTDIRPGHTVYDLMSGMGECWNLIARRLDGRGQIAALDFCPEMCRRSEPQRRHCPGIDVAVMCEDVLSNTIPSASADAVISTFGLKTFSPAQMPILARETARILKPGGAFSFLEISVPRFAPLRWLFMFYLCRVIPLIGWALLGNPDNYRMLGVYTSNFADTGETARCMRAAGLDVREHSFFFGCATAVSGTKPRS